VRKDPKDKVEDSKGEGTKGHDITGCFKPIGIIQSASDDRPEYCPKRPWSVEYSACFIINLGTVLNSFFFFDRLNDLCKERHEDSGCGNSSKHHSSDGQRQIPLWKAKELGWTKHKKRDSRNDKSRLGDVPSRKGTRYVSY